MIDYSEMDNSELKRDLNVEATYRLIESLVAIESKMTRRIDLISEIIFEIDNMGRLVYLNPAWQGALGLECVDCVGQKLRNFVIEEDLPLFDHALAATATPSDRHLIRMRRSEGSVSWMEMSVSPILGGGSVGTIRDATKQKLAQDELNKLSLVASYTDNLVIITNRYGLTE